MVKFDKFGYCVNCQKCMTIKEVIDQKETIRFTPEHTEVEYLLNDGSKMRVCCCMDCKELIKNEKHDEVMNTVIEGWKEELKGSNWTEEKKQKYLDEYSQKSIICSSEGKPKDVLNQKLKTFKEKVKKNDIS